MIGEERWGEGEFTYLKREKKLRGSKRFSQVFRPRIMSVHRSRPAGEHPINTAHYNDLTSCITTLAQRSERMMRRPRVDQKLAHMTKAYAYTNA